MKSFISGIYGIAVAIGGPGLFAVAFLDSSFVSLPQINDILVVLMVTKNKPLMPYYAAMATLGSIAGCYVIYYLAEKGGEAFLRRRVHAHRIDHALEVYRRYGVLALVVPALLPPPAPFKLFVLMAGIADVPPLRFVTAIAVARGLRYVIIGLLAIRYGDATLELVRTHGRETALVMAGLIVLAAVVWARIGRIQSRRDA